MKLMASTELVLAMNPRTLEQACRNSGEYTSNGKFIDEILDHDIRENHVTFKVKFKDDGSFTGDEDCVGYLHVRENDGTYLAEF